MGHFEPIPIDPIGQWNCAFEASIGAFRQAVEPLPVFTTGALVAANTHDVPDYFNSRVIFCDARDLDANDHCECGFPGFGGEETPAQRLILPLRLFALCRRGKRCQRSVAPAR